MLIGRDDFTYTWLDKWAVIPDTESGRANGRTHGVVVSRAGDVLVFHQANPAVLIFDAAGKLKSSWGDYQGAHGMTLVEENGDEFLWLTDQSTREVVKTTLQGKVVQKIEKPPHDVYRDGGGYVPTWVAVNEERFGGNGDIWVADGYGSSLVHRHDKAGSYLGTISGQNGEAGRFACPHGIAFSFRSRTSGGISGGTTGGTPELYVADRGNHRVQVFDAQGRYLRCVGAVTLHSPCMFSFLDDLCLVPQLSARVDILDKDDNVVAMLGDNGYASTRPGWPDHNRTGSPELIQPGRFNSPHGAAFAPNGDIYVVEWIVGGRITKLEKR